MATKKPDRSKYLKLPSEDPYDGTITPNNTIQKAFSEQADKMLSLVIANGAKIFNRQLYRKALEEEVIDRIIEESNKPDDYSLIARIKRHKQMEQNIAKQAKEYAKQEIEKIEAELAKPLPTILPEGYIDARTPLTSNKRSRIPNSKEISGFTGRLLKTASHNTDVKTISK